MRRTGFDPRRHPNRNIVYLDKTLGYDPGDASSNLAISTKKIKRKLVAQEGCVVRLDF